MMILGEFHRLAAGGPLSARWLTYVFWTATLVAVENARPTWGTIGAAGTNGKIGAPTELLSLPAERSAFFGRSTEANEASVTLAANYLTVAGLRPGADWGLSERGCSDAGQDGGRPGGSGGRAQALEHAPT